MDSNKVSAVKRGPKTRLATVVVSVLAILLIALISSIKKGGPSSLRSGIQTFLSFTFSDIQDEYKATADDDDGDFTIASSAFNNDGELPDAYTCDASDGGGSPPLYWYNAPDDTGRVYVALGLMTLFLSISTSFNISARCHNSQSSICFICGVKATRKMATLTAFATRGFCTIWALP
jgi:hypothetical protein